jgi:hypothetical protein
MTKRRLALRSREPLATSVFLSLILVLFFTLPCALVRAEPASSGVSAETTQRVTPGEMNTGGLLLQSDDGGLIEAPRLQTDVVMAVSGTIARVTVTQRFENPSDRWLEGIYVFPLPEQSAVDALRSKAPDTNQRLAVLALVLALLSAVTVIFWRYHRRDYASPRRIGRRI